MTVMFCPHCHDVIEILGEPRAIKCACGAELERYDEKLDEAFDSIFGKSDDHA
jgi:hypothetical protein